MTLAWVSGATLGSVLHHFPGPTRSKGSRGQVRPEIGQKPEKLADFLTIQFLDLPPSGPDPFQGVSGPWGPPGIGQKPENLLIS